MPQRTAKPPLAAWIVRERKRLGLSGQEVARRLRDAGHDAEYSTYRTWEARRRPAPETITALERLFGSTAPVVADETHGADRASELVSALTRQTEALLRQTAALEAQTAVMSELVGWLSSLAAPAVARGVRRALAEGRGRAAGASPGTPPPRSRD